MAAAAPSETAVILLHTLHFVLPHPYPPPHPRCSKPKALRTGATADRDEAARSGAFDTQSQPGALAKRDGRAVSEARVLNENVREPERIKNRTSVDA